MHDLRLIHLLAAWLCLATLFTGLGAHANESDSPQSLESIRDAAIDFVYANSDEFNVTPEVEAGRLDSRLQLAGCSAPLEGFAAPGGLRPGNSVIGVRCDGEKPWKLFVPVEVKLPGTVVVAARALERGKILESTDLVLERVNLAGQHRGYFESPARLIGKKLKRSVTRSTVLAPRMLTRDKIVRRGADVMILAGGDRFSVRMRGKALSDGGRGDRVEVRNLSSGRKISATVVESGVVSVTH